MLKLIEITNGDLIEIALVIVGALIVVFAVIGLVISIFLAIKYIKYNRRKNSIGKTGQEVAREILDDNGLKKIKVSCVGSLLFGNSYSHFFKKVRLRRLTYKKKSVSSLAMATQKSALAILDKENDKDMKRRNRLIPLVTFGPFALIPLIAIGVIIDIIILKSENFYFTLVFCSLGFLFYIFSFILSFTVLKVEKKAQSKAYKILKDNKLCTNDELNDIKALFKLYNLEYINDMILSFLEILYRILQIVSIIYSKKGSSIKK